jgi:hypothetical protein
MIDKSGAPAAPMMMMPIPHNLGGATEKRAQRIDDHSR